MKINIAEFGRDILLASAVLGLFYRIALKAGYVINEARAATIAQQAVEQEERARLEFQRETKYTRLRFLNGLAATTPDDELEMESLRAEIAQINQRLLELKGA